MVYWRGVLHRWILDVKEAHCAQVETFAEAGFARRLQRTGWNANFMSYVSTKWAGCQDQYILGELFVRTDWEVVVGARVTSALLQTGRKRI